MTARVHQVVQLAAEGHHGVSAALDRIRTAFGAEVLGGTDGEARRDLTSASLEWQRAVCGAVSKLRADVESGRTILSTLGGYAADDANLDLAVFSAWLADAEHKRENVTVPTSEPADAPPVTVPRIIDKRATDGERDLATIFATYYRDRLRWVDDRKVWARYDDAERLWQLSTADDPRVVGMWHALREDQGLQCIVGNGEFGDVPGSLRLARSVIESARDMLFSSSTDFDNLPEHEWPCANGVLDTRTRTLRPYSAADLVTERFAVAFDPTATAERLDEWMTHAFSPAADDGEPDLASGAERARFVRRYQVAAQVPTFSAVTHQFLVMNGPGGSGKGTFGADLPRALFARYFRTMDGGYFLKRNATGKHRGNIADSITGARLVAVDEAIGTAAAIDTDFLKEFTGSATMHTERKHGTPGEAPRPLLTFLTNDTDMNFGKQDTGIRRRMIAVSLPWGADHREATGQTGDHRGLFRDLFEAEGSGVLNMYLDALDEVRANYAANGDPLAVPEDIKAETAETWSTSSFVGRALQHFRPIGPDEIDAPVLTLDGVHAFLWDLAEATEPGGAVGVGLKGPRELRRDILAVFPGARVDEPGKGRGRIPGLGDHKFTRVHRLTAASDSGAYLVEETSAAPRVTTDEVDEWRADHPRVAKVKVARTLKFTDET
nr:DUF5906 domain-containing protein [Gordonia humi]